MAEGFGAEQPQTRSPAPVHACDDLFTSALDAHECGCEITTRLQSQPTPSPGECPEESFVDLRPGAAHSFDTSRKPAKPVHYAVVNPDRGRPFFACYEVGVYFGEVGPRTRASPGTL